MANDGRADRSALRDYRFGVVSSSGDATPGGRTLDKSLLGVQRLFPVISDRDPVSKIRLKDGVPRW